MRRRALKTLTFLVILLSLCFPGTADAAGSAAGAPGAYLQGIFDFVDANYQGEADYNAMMSGALRGLFGSLDQYSAFYTAAEAEQFFRELDGVQSGVGIRLQVISGMCVIMEVLPGSPAAAAGLRIGDRIASVDGVSLDGKTAESAAEQLRGKEGTAVTLVLRREGESAPVTRSIIRVEYALNPVSYSVDGDIAYIRLSSFGSNAGAALAEALAETDRRGVTGIIFDLRDNPGGELEQALRVSELLLPAGPLVHVKYKSASEEDMTYYIGQAHPAYRLAVLVNARSASAAEIVAGAIQDNGAGVLIGEKTFGKSRVQSLYPLLRPDKYAVYKAEYGTVNACELPLSVLRKLDESDLIGWIKLTTGEYLTPRGRRLDGTGLIPDKPVADYRAMRGIDVREIQPLRQIVKPSLDGMSIDVYNAEKILLLAGYPVEEPDLVLDRKTFLAIKQFQADTGLYPYGGLDFVTQRTLNAKLGELLSEIDKPYAEGLEILRRSQREASSPGFPAPAGGV